jgi:hypothetical protein
MRMPEQTWPGAAASFIGMWIVNDGGDDAAIPEQVEIGTRASISVMTRYHGSAAIMARTHSFQCSL